MKRKKKISFSYSLYKTKKPTINKDGEKEYPVYMRVVYDRKSTKFLMPVGMGFMDIPNEYTEKDFENTLGKDDDYNEQLEGIIEKVVRYEANKLGDKYSIKGIHERLNEYSHYIGSLISRQLYHNIKFYLGEHLAFNFFNSILEGIEYELKVGMGSDFYVFYKSLEQNLKFNFMYAMNEGKAIDHLIYGMFLGAKITTLKPLLSDTLINKIVAVIAYELYEMNAHRNSEEDFRLIDWIYDSPYKSNFSSFVDSGKLSSKAVKMKNLPSSMVYVIDQYSDELNSITGDMAFAIVNQMVNKSYPVQAILGKV